MTKFPEASATMVEMATAIVGPEHVDASGEGCVVSPQDAVQASAVLRAADAAGLAVSIEGSGSKVGWLGAGCADVRLKTQRMDAVLEHTWQDMTCTVEAGCSWQAMQEALAVHGQQVALDPLWPGRATVGGVIAANDSGALRLRYGGMRDLVIGMTAVLADGTIARSGGKVVKNVAGYDLPKLLCGSYGTLAMIAEVTFRLHSIAPNTATISVNSQDAMRLGELSIRLLDSKLSVQSMQMRGQGSGYALDVRLVSLPEVLVSQQADIARTAKNFGLEICEAQDAVWGAREELFGGRAMVVKATTLPTRIASVAGQIVALGGRVVAQATGILMASFADDVATEGLGSLRRELEVAGGSLTLLQGAPGGDFDRWGRLADTLPPMRAVKRQFDPNGVLNPGRFLGGI